MDFMSLLDTASKNAKNVSKKLDDLKTEVDSERRAELKRIEAERIKKTEILNKKKKMFPPKPIQEERKFVIPKKDKSDDKAKVMAYLAKKSEEERRLLMEKKAEKERLIQLRLQANGGKATKKMAKNFGMSALDLQVKYGNDREHVERLQKQKWREEASSEEQDRLATHYRDGVYKALAQKRKLDEKVAHCLKFVWSTDTEICNRFHTYRRSSSEPSKHSKSGHAAPEKKVKPAPVIAFSELMKAAQGIAEGKDVKLEPKPINKIAQKRLPDLMPKDSSAIPLYPSGSTRKPENRLHLSTSLTAKSFSSTSKPVEKPRDDLNVKKEKKDDSRRVRKGATPPPLIPPPVPGKRYLPGDIRYKQAMEMAKQSCGSTNTTRDQPSSSKKMSLASQALRMESNKGNAIGKEIELDRRKNGSQFARGQHRSPSRNETSLKHYPTSNHRERTRERDLSRHRRTYERDRRSEQRHNSYTRAYDYDSFHEEDYDEDEYDSEMEDFIDDSGLDMEELSRQEFEETLK
uniref:Protein SPT2 homolog n=1 Tax=Angiostrongylus cantonensis TaxID=6313 RepID=A0A0K0DN32_ANGCA